MADLGDESGVIAKAIEEIVHHNESYISRTQLPAVLEDMLVSLVRKRPRGEEAVRKALLEWAREEKRRLESKDAEEIKKYRSNREEVWYGYDAHSGVGSFRDAAGRQSR
eukprot:Hpha_TRINITY_DN33023_c0_g1::TRINITY_DN33023_c0_g1_i1::g.158670::m.158670